MISPSDPVDAPFAEQALGAHQEESERQHVGKPGLDAAADVRADVDLGDFFRCAYDKPADDGPAIDSNPPRISTGSAFSARKGSPNRTPLRAPPSSPACRSDPKSP